MSTRFKPEKRSLMLGRQAFRLGQGKRDVRTTPHRYQKALKVSGHHAKLSDLTQPDHFSENMFREIGFGEIESLDMSDYQGATLQWDLNQPVPLDWHGQFSFIFDGGTLEHVFNIPQAFANVFNMLAEGGRFVGLNPYNGFPSHGMYQFSPELVWTYWKHGCGCTVHSCRAIHEISNYSRNLPDPTELGGRLPVKLGLRLQGRMPWNSVLLWYEVERTRGASIASSVQQSDYLSTWGAAK